MASIDNTGEITDKQSAVISEVFSTSATEPEPKIDYKNELVFYFFNSMLDAVIDTWEAFGVIECPESIYSVNNIRIESEDWPSVEVDETVEAEGESQSRFSKYSFLKSSVQIEDHPKKNRTSSAKLDLKTKTNKKSITGRKSKKSLRKRTLSNRQKEIDSALQTVPSDTWIIEPVAEYVIITFKNGNMYEGPILGKLMHGSGKFTWADGTTYTGNFERGDLTGQGELILADRSRYTGGFVRGYRHSQGVMSVAEAGALYRGSWRAGTKQGRGWQLFRPNDWYDGEWDNDAMNGSGIRQYPSGARYQGFWKNGKRDGKGCAVMKNNDFYTGDWSQGKRKGYGDYTWCAFYNKTFSVPIQSSYFGSWDKNQMHGIGLINFGMEGGARYAGCFENNEKHGAGVIVCENGSTIESNPLFLNDKPVHLTYSGSFNLSIDEENNQSNSESVNFSTESMNNFVNSSFASDYTAERKPSILKSITTQISLPTNSLDKATIANIELCKLAFPKIQENYLSLCVPVNTPTEIIVLNHYMKKITEYLFTSTIIQPKDLLSLLADSKALNASHLCCPDSPKINTRSPASSVKENAYNAIRKYQLEYEERNLRKSITTHLPKLRMIYKQYTTVACLKVLPFKTLLIRMFLWQLYRDCKIPQKGISLSKLDELLAENPDTELETQHSPFEIIYFWQFLHSLITVALNLYAKECSKNVNEGILKSCFVKFLETDIFPNYGHHTGCILFDYVDILPLKAAYKWFLEFKEPFTVLKFLQNACTIKKCDPPEYYSKFTKTEDIDIQMGINAYAIGHEITYLQDELPNIQTEPIREEIKVSDSEIYKRLFCLRKLGAKTVLSILSEVCPSVKENNDIINMQYEITFYEFYETVLLCTQEFINRENERKYREKLAEEEYLLQAQSDLNTTILRKSRGRRTSTKKKIQIQQIN